MSNAGATSSAVEAVIKSTLSPSERLVADAPELDVPHEHEEAESRVITLPERLTILGAIVLPFIAVIAGVVLLWGGAVNLWYLALTGVFYAITVLGITIGYHRMITHKSFDADGPVRGLFAAMGSMALEGPAVEWAAVHRRHHRHSDHEDDPHSPHLHGGGPWGVIKGFIHAHLGWLLTQSDRPDLDRWAPDLQKDRVLMAINRTFLLWAVAGFVLPALIAGLVTMSWTGALLGLLWGGLVRVFLVHHVTWCVNSICHVWGTQPFKSHDESRNNPIVGLLAFGEGWHNNHHAFPASARHGLKWWQFDISWIVIRTMQRMKLVRNVRVPTQDRLDAKSK